MIRCPCGGDHEGHDVRMTKLSDDSRLAFVLEVDIGDALEFKGLYWGADGSRRALKHYRKAVKKYGEGKVLLTPYLHIQATVNAVVGGMPRPPVPASEIN